MLDHALRLARIGWRVFPIYEPIGINICSCRMGPACGLDAHGVPRGVGKHPRVKGGFKVATIDEATIRAWWKQWPNANIGIRTGDGLFVVDVDGADGEAALAELGPIPPTVESTTGQGRHLFFTTDKHLPSTKGKLGNKIDTRGQDGYVIVPPSLHRLGDRYQLVHPPWGDLPIAPLPESLRARLVLFPGADPAPPLGTAQSHGRSGPDNSRSGLDQKRTVDLVRRGLPEAEIHAHFVGFSEKFAEKFVSSGERTAEDYFRRTLASAQRLHAHGLIRAIGYKVRDIESLPGGNGVALLRRVVVELVTTDGEILRQRLKVTAPDDAHPSAVGVWQGVMRDTSWRAVFGESPGTVQPGAWDLVKRLVIGHELEIVHNGKEFKRACHSTSCQRCRVR